MAATTGARVAASTCRNPCWHGAVTRAATAAAKHLVAFHRKGELKGRRAALGNVPVRVGRGLDVASTLTDSWQPQAFVWDCRGKRMTTAKARCAYKLIKGFVCARRAPCARKLAELPQAGQVDGHGAVVGLRP